jgi:glycosyltransferase involved in cell wall biosynthesis
MSKQMQETRIAILANPEGGGGITRVVLNLLKGMNQRGISLDLVLDWAEGRPYLKDVPTGVRVVDLGTKIGFQAKSAIKLVPPLIKYLKQEKPDLLLCHLTLTNWVAVVAWIFAKVPVRLVLVEHLPLPNPDRSWRRPQSQLPRLLRAWLYPKADAVVAVSKGMARALETGLKLRTGSVGAIYNPVVDERLVLNAQLPIEHPWFGPNQPPVFLAVGRLTGQKDFSLLLQAFAQLRKQREARLLILGEGPLRKPLEGMVAKLGIEADVLLPGFVKNPYAYMSRASVFVLSSRWEGLPTVLIEAIACGCQVVSTDCPHGPREILAEGKYGQLVPVTDVSALAAAMQTALDSPIAIEELKQRSQDFSVERAVTEYLKLIDLAAPTPLP